MIGYNKSMNILRAFLSVKGLSMVCVKHEEEKKKAL